MGGPKRPKRGWTTHSSARARKILADHSPDKVEGVATAIAAHRFRSGPAPETPEERALFDADKLDALGAIGIAGAFAHAGRRGRPLWVLAPVTATQGDGTADHTPVHEFIVKLSRLPEAMTTATGRVIAEERYAFMAQFFARLDAEVRGEH